MHSGESSKKMTPLFRVDYLQEQTETQNCRIFHLQDGEKKCNQIHFLHPSLSHPNKNHGSFSMFTYGVINGFLKHHREITRVWSFHGFTTFRTSTTAMFRLFAVFSRGFLESRYGFCFPPEFRDFLQAGVPIGGGWPDWHELASGEILLGSAKDMVSEQIRC